MTSTLGQFSEEPGSVAEREIREAEAAAARAAEAASERALARSVENLGGRPKRWKTRYSVLLFGADTVAAISATVLAYLVRPRIDLTLRARAGFLGDHLTYTQLGIVTVTVWLASLAALGAYRSNHFGGGGDFRLPVIAALRIVAAVAIVSYAFRMDLSRALVGAYFVTLIVAVVIGRGGARLLLRHARKQGRAHVRLLLVGERRSVRDFADHLLAAPTRDYDLVGVCASGPSSPLQVRGRALPVLAAPDDVVEAADAVQADAVLIANPAGLVNLSLQQLTWQLEHSRIDILVAPDAVALAGPRLKVSTVRGLPVTHVVHPRHESVLRAVHFGLSRLAGAVLAVLASPLMLAVAVAVRIDSPGRVLYRQKRIGFKGREFEMLKFRSMVPNAEELLPTLLELNEHDGALFKIRDDPRITRIGRILRKYSLDELPQLFNVVKGDMTLVGPRPCLARELTMFGEAEHRRFMVRPGMTGLWQVSGGPGMDWTDAVKTDLYYVDNWSPGLDLAILARTIKVVLRGSGY